MAPDVQIPSGVIRWGELAVPFVAAWSSESRVRIAPDPLCGRRPALYRDGRRGLGTPMFGKMDEARSREVIVRKLCQVCARPWRGEAFAIDVPFGLVPITSEPPVCKTCFALSLATCPGIARMFEQRRVNIARVYDYDVILVTVQPVVGGTPELSAALATWTGEPPVGYARARLTRFAYLAPGDIDMPVTSVSAGASTRGER